MDLDGFVRVDVLKEPFELNGFRQVIILLGNAADEEGFRLISGLDSYLRKRIAIGITSKFNFELIF